MISSLQLPVANTSLQCMCCSATRGIWHRAAVERRAPFCSVLCPAWLGCPVCCPCCPFTWPFTAQHSCWPEESAKIFFTSLSPSLFRFSLLLLVFMVCQLTRLLHLFNTNRVQLGKPKGAAGGRGVDGYCRRCRRNE